MILILTIAGTGRKQKEQTLPSKPLGSYGKGARATMFSFAKHMRS